MAYFLKKSNLKKGIYLQIYESFYNHDKKGTAHKSYKAIGYVQDLINSGISDPIAYYSDIIAQMNIEAKRIKEENKVKQIGESPESYLDETSDLLSKIRWSQRQINMGSIFGQAI